MNYKEFLKPTKGKIIFLVLLGSITIFCPIYIYYSHFSRGIVSAFWGIFSTIFLFPFIFFGRVAGTIPVIIYWYLIICFISWLFKRTEQKNEL